MIKNKYKRYELEAAVMLYLKALNTADTRQEYQFFQEIQSESGFLNPYHGISYSDFVHQAVPERIDASRIQGPGLWHKGSGTGSGGL